MIIRLSAFALLTFGMTVLTPAADEKKGKGKKDAQSEADGFYAKLDNDEDGKVTAKEFVFLPNVMRDARRASNTFLTQLFARLDKNKDKSISKEEFSIIRDFVKPTDPPKKKKADPKKKKNDKK